MSLSLVIGWHWPSPADMFAVHSFSDKQSRKRSERSMPPLFSPDKTGIRGLKSSNAFISGLNGKSSE